MKNAISNLPKEDNPPKPVQNRTRSSAIAAILASQDKKLPFTGYNYTKSIQEIHLQLKEKKLEELKKLKEEEKRRQKELEIYQGKYTRFFFKIWSNTFGKLGEDWVFLALLGIIVAIISYTIDKGIMMCNKGQMWLYHDLSSGLFTKWVAWICIPFCLVMWDVGLTHLLAPQAAGSGIPQLKTSLRGVFMKEVLTFKVLIAKWLGIIATIGSGMPLGKEGPLIHMSSIIVTKMSNFISNFNKIYDNESKKIEMLGAAWAVGVACTFNAPIGGVLFSVEITTAYYAVRNYWRGFFAAVWGATTYRLLLVWIDKAQTITVIFKANFFIDIPYDPLELISFAILGLICGLGGSLYINCKQMFDRWVNNNKFIKKVKKSNRFLYPGFVILLISTVTWPPGIGQFMAAEVANGPQVIDLFSNFTWTKENLTVLQQEVVSHWTTDRTGIFADLAIYIWYQFIFSILASSLPIPNGSFIPNFRAGAALGRIAGELMYCWFPTGIGLSQIMPGAYSAVGAAAFAGAVTHTMSVCVILFEMTSSISHVIPVLIAVLIANGVARFLSPSIYDLVIRSKKLPYLPDLLPNTSGIYEVYVEDFMITKMKYLYLGMSYAELKELLTSNPKINVFPLVEHSQTMTLLGSIPKTELIILLDKKIGTVKRRQFLPSPMVDRSNDSLENVEMIQSTRKRSHVHIDDSSDSEKEDEQVGTKMKTIDETKEHTIEEKREEILRKWKPTKKSILPRLIIPKSPLPDRKSTLSLSNLESPSLRICDLPLNEQQAWESEQLKSQVDFTTARIDPAPFQLVERTSLLKVHSLFSLLAINFAYVTSIGKLVGVVGLKELRQAIEDANSGNPPKRANQTPRSPLTPNTPIPQVTIQITPEPEKAP
ncbi:chloride channel protein 2 isoform X2 [Leptinotarsa decemlineata]|uniref:chloride channel protein 2 isoform X2 n=1 Tax=Leptinotarsa decemlineata TaxID=7539 RepID=UPI003D30D2AC